MAPETKAPKPKPTGDKAKPAAGKAEKAEKPKKKVEAAPAEAAPVAKAPAEPPKPRPPADPRLKVLKKFAGRFLPKGPLRERHKALMTRWNSGDDHGGVTVEELKALLDDWRASRAKPARTPQA